MFLKSLEFCYILGSQAQEFASIRYPPCWDISDADSRRTLNFSQFNLDLTFLFSYVVAQMKDMILEVRSQ